ncbi:MAG TPA: hypothetical protein VNU01_03170 [Egibacteraceae bacterium]|nr:hypothetical protein [Egibacteraceae bacterium]
MRIRATGLLAAIGLLVGMMAAPASADAPTDAGIFNGQASVSQDRGTDQTKWCQPDGTFAGLNTQTGVGLPLLGGVDKAYWKIDAPQGAVISLARVATGSLQMCGELAPLTTSPAQLGASCITTKGSNGQGFGDFDGDQIWLSGLSWEATVGGTFTVTAKAGSTQGDTGSDLVAIVQALDEAVLLNCLSQNGARTFNVQAVYAVV